PQIQRKDVALALSITPHVAAAAAGEASGDALITLDIDLESCQLGTENFTGLGATWKERTLTTTVVLHDDESLVLGGLVSERTELKVDKIPLLGDLPLLGVLFRSTTK